MNPIEGVLAGLSARRRMQRDDEDAADRVRQRRQEDEDRADQREDRAYTMSQRAKAVKLADDMAAAAAPVNVEQVQPAGPVMEGAPGAAGQAIPQVSTVRGRSFETPAAADAAAAEHNSMQAVAGRQAQVAQSAGNPALAQQLRTGAMAEQSAKYKLSADERAELDARFNADLQSRVNSWETFDQFTSDSAGDGFGGKLKLRTTVSPDGKTRLVNVVGPDGALTPTGQTFQNTADGLGLATTELARMSPEKKLAHLRQKEQDRRAAAAQASTETYQAGMLGVAQAAQKSTAQHQQATAAHQARMEGISAAKNQQAGMTMADLKDGHKGIASTLNADWKTQIEAVTGNTPADQATLKAIKVARENEIATVQRLYTGAMSAGFALTPEQAIVAFRSGTAGTQAFTTKDGKSVPVDGVMYGGKFIPLAANPGATSAEPAKPATKPKDEPKAVKAAAAGGKPGAAAAPSGAIGAPGAQLVDDSGTLKKIARAADGREWKNLAAGR